MIITLFLMMVLFSSCKSAKEKSIERLEKLYENVCLSESDLTQDDKIKYQGELEIVNALLSQYTFEQKENAYLDRLLVDCSKKLDVNLINIPKERKNPDSIEKVGDWSEEEKKIANTAASANYMNEDEKLVIFYTNLARINGSKFAALYVNNLLQEDKSDNVVSLYQDLRNKKGLNPLKPDSILHETAKYHALDMGRNGMTGHNSSDGTSFGNRVMKQYGVHLVGENCYYGPNDPFDIVLSLLIDKGVRSLGHRKNLLNADFSEIGVSIERHNSAYQYNCVQDFGSKE